MLPQALGCVLLAGIIASACYMLVVGPRGTYHVHFLICFLAQHFLGACFAGGAGGLWECVEESAQGLRTFQGWQRGTATPPGRNRIPARVPDCLPVHPPLRDPEC